MLNLARLTDPGWAKAAVLWIDEILVEQAHLEKKAAAAALRFLFKYQDRAVIQQPLSALAREELEHFEIVLGQLERRGLAFGPQHASPYAAGLISIVREDERGRLIDSFLCSAMIEARSCERMKLLGEALRETDAELSELYKELVASEARHHSTYVKLLESMFPVDEVRRRLVEVAEHEATVLERMPEMARLHANAPSTAPIGA